MALNINTQITLQASPEKVWNLLLDFENYPNWNPFIKSLKGKPQVGNQLEALIEGLNGKDMTFTPTVLAATPNQELRWLGKLWVKGLFDGEHYFKLQANANGTTTFTHGENFSGLLVPLFKKKLLANTQQGFTKMNEQLKEVVERKWRFLVKFVGTA